jgi:hypothetical protein
MKKRTLLLLTGCTIVFASCNNPNSSQADAQQKIDSMVNAKTADIQSHIQSKNDSIINVLAKVKADSIIAAAKNAPVRSMDTSRSRGYGYRSDTQASIQKPAAPPATLQK